jgi:hypothetical protein
LLRQSTVSFDNPPSSPLEESVAPMKKTFSINGVSKKFTSGSEQIFDSVVNASYTKYEKQEIPPIDLKVAEMHSMMLVMYKQIAKLEEKLISAGENKKRSSE